LNKGGGLAVEIVSLKLAGPDLERLRRRARLEQRPISNLLRLFVLNALNALDEQP
jgi:hypothetical protein